MAIKKSELYTSLWKSCDELRGGMDASQYKDYVLVLLFVKYVSDKAASQKDYLLDVPKGGSFADMVALKGDKEIGDTMNKIIAKLADKNELKGVIDVADWNDADKLGKGKDMVDRLSNLVAIFDNPALDFRGNRAEGDDLLGDAYEYLMRHFATESGKSKGQFYTPAEVYGQEMDNATKVLTAPRSRAGLKQLTLQTTEHTAGRRRPVGERAARPSIATKLSESPPSRRLTTSASSSRDFAPTAASSLACALPSTARFDALS